MSRFYVPLASLSPADRVREALDRAEIQIVNVRGQGVNALELLHLFDSVAVGLAELEQSGADIRAERTRFDTVLGMFRTKQRRFLAEVGSALREERESVNPEQARWWWFIDHVVAEERQQTVRKYLTRGAIAVAVLLVLGLLYDRFLAPPPHVREAMRHTSSGESMLDQRDLRGALAEFEAAAALTPDDYSVWVDVGVVHEALGEDDAAERAFETARQLSDGELSVLLKRSQTYQRMGELDRALADADEAIEQSPDSGWAYVLRANVYAELGRYDEALADLDTVDGLASGSGDVQLEAYARTQRAMIIQSSMAAFPVTSTP
ncbi:MAG: tetratricopeptide repeat protein [Chloroflexi bacterium]|nr:tetratricopeptide repeat protein [Chloroflexota bacterium]